MGNAFKRNWKKLTGIRDAEADAQKDITAKADVQNEISIVVGSGGGGGLSLSSRTIADGFSVTSDDNGRTLYYPAGAGILGTIDSGLPEDFFFRLVNGSTGEVILRPSDQTEYLSAGGKRNTVQGTGIVIDSYANGAWQKISDTWVGIAGMENSSIAGMSEEAPVAYTWYAQGQTIELPNGSLYSDATGMALQEGVSETFAVLDDQGVPQQLENFEIEIGGEIIIPLDIAGSVTYGDWSYDDASAELTFTPNAAGAAIGTFAFSFADGGAPLAFFNLDVSAAPPPPAAVYNWFDANALQDIESGTEYFQNGDGIPVPYVVHDALDNPQTLNFPPGWTVSIAPGPNPGVGEVILDLGLGSGSVSGLDWLYDVPSSALQLSTIEPGGTQWVVQAVEGPETLYFIFTVSV